MTNVSNIGRHIAAIALTIVVSTTMLLGAVGPAETATRSPSEIVRAIA